MSNLIVLKKLVFLLVFVTGMVNAQVIYGKWQDYFSYFNILDVIENGDELICATENGLFSYNKVSGELQKISKATGLHGVKVSAIAYNAENDYLIVAYKNGAFDVITPEGIEYFVDIPIDTDFQGDKAVNHIVTVGDKAIFSMDFGVLLFDLPRLEFDETTYFRNGSEYFIVNESLILGEEVIALSENGIYTHPIDDLIPNFNAWTAYFTGTEFKFATQFMDKGIVATSSSLYSTTNGSDYTPISNSGTIVDLNSTSQRLSVVHSTNISEYDGNLNLVNSHDFGQPITTGICTSSEIYGGTSLIGLLPLSTLEPIAPDGPYKNTSYKLTLFEDQIYVAPGGRNSANFYQLLNNRDGYYHYKNQTWHHASYSEITQRNISELAVNPLNTEQVFGAVYAGNGNVVTLDDQLDYIINSSNSSFITHPSLGMVCITNIFDKDGNYYAVESYTPPTEGNNLNIRTPTDQWVNIHLELGNTTSTHLFQDKKGWLWIGCPRENGGLVAYNTNGTPTNTSDDEQYLLKSGENYGFLPQEESVICITQDRSGTMWFGTSRGIRIKRNANTELENGNLDTELIVVEDNGLPEEFLKDVLVLDIAVDEANNKWISTSGGIFYVSPDGTETKKFFDYNNSPLPSNYNTDIEIDPKTGKVYFASLDGIVSYQGDYIEAGDEFGDIIVYPNPVRPNFQGNVVIKGLANNAKVKITDINGNLVHQGVAKGGAIEWDQNNLQGKRVASGIYLALMLNENNLITATAKFAIVR